MYTEVNKLQIRVDSAGKGPVVLVLHGWGETMDDFKYLSDKLEANYKVVRIDLPGFGNSQAPKDIWGPRQYSTFIKYVLDKLKIGNIYAIVSHSFGAQVAFYGLSHDILDAKKLVAISADYQTAVSSPRRLLVKILGTAGRYSTMLLPTNTRFKIRQYAYTRLGYIDYVILNQQHMKAIYQYFQKINSGKEVVFLKTPTLLIYGARDIDTPPDCGKVLEQLIKNSKLIIIPKCGHSPHIEQNKITIKHIKEFLA